MTYDVVIPSSNRRKRSPLTLREKVELLARCKLRGEDPAEVVPPLYRSHGLELPKHPAQPLSGFAIGLKNRVAKGDQEAISLAKEFGFELRETVAETGAPPAAASASEVA